MDAPHHQQPSHLPVAAAPKQQSGQTGADKAEQGETTRRERGEGDQLTALLAAQMGHLLDALPDGVIITDDAGHIQLANRQAEFLFGYDREDLLGIPVEALMPERFHRAHPAHRGRYTAHPHVRPMGSGLQLFGRRRDGAEFPVEISLSPIEVAGAPLVLATIRDVTGRRELERRAREAVEARVNMLQAVLGDLPVGVYLARGRDAELVLANPRVADIWGAGWPEGRPMVTFLAESGARVHDPQGRELPPDDLATLRALRTGRPVRHHQEVIRRPDGSSLSVQVDAVVLDPGLFPHLGGADARPAASEPEPLALVVHQDVTALKEAERLKDEFVALAAHELRSPVASLLGYAQLLVQTASPRKSARRGSPSADDQSTAAARGTSRGIPRAWQEEATTAVMEASQRLAGLTDDLLDATRLQANRLDLRPEPLELGALVRRVVRRAQVTTKRHSMRVSSPDEPVIVEADVRRVEQVVANLLSNAVKYSPAGGPVEVTVSVCAIPAAPDASSMPGGAHPAPSAAEPPVTGEWVRVAVRDHGIGIPAEQYDRIFCRFGRADNARESGIPGTGLGLYLSRELIERQGGRLWFESTEGAGATFTFELPHWTEPE